MRSSRNKRLIAISDNQRVFSFGGRKATSSTRPESYKRAAEKSGECCAAMETQSGVSRSERVINTRQQENGKYGREITAAH
jgi:hypothetical protein